MLTEHDDDYKNENPDDYSSVSFLSSKNSFDLYQEDDEEDSIQNFFHRVMISLPSNTL